MGNLAAQSCEPCKGDSPAVPEREWGELLGELPGWHIVEREGVPRLTRDYRLADFAAALEAAQAVGALAEAENHHPELVAAYGRLTVSWWTHAIDGLHKNDFIMAARTEEALNT
ncbi:MAG: 4a-hydroxytetrahydrobiopterin dehydratase [Pseudomonadota bacterium]